MSSKEDFLKKEPTTYANYKKKKNKRVYAKRETVQPFNRSYEVSLTWSQLNVITKYDSEWNDEIYGYRHSDGNPEF